MSPDPPAADPLQQIMPPSKRDRPPKPSRAAYEQLRPAPRMSEDNIKVSIPVKGLWKCLVGALVLATLCVICCVVVVEKRRLVASWADTALLGTGIPNSQKNGVPVPAAARFNCSKDYLTWQLDWSVHKQRWCCAHTGYACPRASRHECHATAVQVEAWSEDKRRYCCKHKNYGCPLATLSNTSSSHHTAPSHEPSNSSNSSSNSSNRSNSSSIVNRVSSPKYVGSDVGTATGSAHLMLHSRKDANSSNSSRTGAAVSSGTSSSSRAHHVSARRLRAAEVVQDFFHQHTQELGEPAVSPKQLSSHSLRGLPVDNSVQMQ